MAARVEATKINRRTRRYWLRLFRLFAVALAGTLILVPLGLGVATGWSLSHPACRPGSDPSLFGIPYEDVTFPSARNIIQQGFFIPGDNGATLIVAPALGNDRGGDLHYADVFHRAGFNVLTFNGRSCTSYGMHSLGYQEVEDVEAAYAYLSNRPDVDPERVSLHGFSSAGATSLMATARMPQIRSVSAEGGYHNYSDMLGIPDSLNFFDRLYVIGVSASYRIIIGDDVSTLDPLNAIGQIGPRPVLLIYGSDELSLPGARLMLQHALDNGVDAQLWVVEGAGHGGYLSVAREEFERRVIAFHSAALLSEQ